MTTSFLMTNPSTGAPHASAHSCIERGNLWHQAGDQAEAANLTKAQITLQAGVAALAQANSAPQQILSLLRG